MRLNMVYQIITSNRWTLTFCRNNVFKIIYVLITKFFFPKFEAHKKMFHLLSYDLIQSEASKYKVSNGSSPSVVDSFSVNSCSYELFAMNSSFIFLASASSSSPSSTSLSKALLPSSWSLRSSDVSIKVPGVATFHGLKLGVLFALCGCFAFLILREDVLFWICVGDALIDLSSFFAPSLSIEKFLLLANK